MAEQRQGVTALPKNIRQIGTNTGNTRVYLEDYVYTFLHNPEEEKDWIHRGFVLLGRQERHKEFVRYFISGLIRIKDSYFKDDVLEFDDETWAHIYQEMKKYYDNLEIVGWGQDVSNASASLTAEIERLHKQNFNIQKNVLFLIDHVENEEAFYIFEKNMLQRREGYYVYYEKNPQMQEYMVQAYKSQELDIPLEEIKEPLVRSYRETMMDKKAQMAARRWNGILYTTSLLLVLSVCVLGVSTVNNVEKMQNLEMTVSQISSQAGQGAGAFGANSSPAISTNTKQAESEGTSQEEDAESGTSDKNASEDSKNLDKTGKKDKKSGSSTSDDPDQTDQTKDDSTQTLTEAQTYLLQGYYIVKKGDSLASISNKIYGTPKKAKKICDLNGIEDMDKIYAGQKLELP